MRVKILPYVMMVLALCVVLPARAQKLFPGLGEQRVGISSFTFLKIGVGARSAALGESFIAMANDASALYWNPAGMVQINANDVLFGHTEWFADIKHEFAGAVVQLTSEDAVGLSVIALYTDDMPVTTTVMPTGTGEMFSFRDLAFGLSYSRRMTDQFSFGITARYVNERLAQLTMQNLLFDVGAYYLTGFSTARFAITVSNFGGTAKPSGSVNVFGVGTVDQFEEFSPPTMFRLGFAMDPILNETHRLTTSIQLNHPNDNAENLGLGVEYGWNNTVFLRVGYRVNVQEQRLPSFGVGARVPVELTVLTFDYGATDFGLLGMAHRFSLGISL